MQMSTHQVGSTTVICSTACMEYEMNNMKYLFLVGGDWNMTFIFHILGIIVPIDFHIVQRGSNHQPDLM